MNGYVTWVLFSEVNIGKKGLITALIAPIQVNRSFGR